jgi:parallel beta-helix repeat protein
MKSSGQWSRVTSVLHRKAFVVPLLVVVFVAIGVVWVQSEIRPVHDGGLHDEEIVVDVTPNRPIATDNLMCSIITDSSDQDGDATIYTYAWYKDDDLEPYLTTTTVSTHSFLASNHTPQGDVWTCAVTVGDSVNDSSGGYDEVTIAQEADEATYYVDTNNGDDAFDGRSTDNPFRTIGKAASVVEPGDVVYIRDGTYWLSSHLWFSVSGTSENPIIFEAYPGDEVIIDGSELSGEDRDNALLEVTASWNVFRNFEVRNSLQQGIYVTGNDNVFENIVTHNNYLSGFQIVGGSVGGSRNLLLGVVSHHNYDPDTEGGDADGVGISSGSDNVLVGCVVHDNSDDGIDTWESTNNVIENCVSYMNGYMRGDGNGFKLGPGHDGAALNIVRNCIAYDNTANGYDNNSGGGSVIESCTAYGNGAYDFVNYDYVNTFRSNIAYGGGVDMLGHPAQSRNSWELNIDDPGFLSTDDTSPDFLSLSSGSPARDKGDSGIDLGALQYGEKISDLAPKFRVFGVGSAS